MTSRARVLDAVVFVAALGALLWGAPDLTFYLESPDHGSHLSFGREVTLGGFPFVDVFYHYGPLDAFSVALGIWATGSLLGETVICALGYAVALWLVFALVRRGASPLPGAAAAVAACVLLARFHKCEYWLFPLLALWSLESSFDRPSRARAVRGGFVAGVAALYRLDLGLACLCAHWIAWMLVARRHAVRAHAPAYLAGLFAAPALWLALLVRHGGWRAIADYGRASIDGAGRSPPGNRCPSRASTGTIRSASIRGWRSRSCSCRWPTRPRWWSAGAVSAALAARRARALLVAGVFGFGIFPQSLHRSEAQHLLQVVPPAIVVAGLLGAELMTRWRAHRLAPWQQAGSLLLAASFALAGLGLARNGGKDLVWRSTPLREKYRDLVRDVRPTDGTTGALVKTLRTGTAPDDRILVATLQWQLYYFAERPMSGYVPAYALGHLDSPEWRQRNLEAVLRDPPKAVIAYGDRTGAADQEFRASQPELWHYLAEHYTHVMGRVGGNVILTHNDDGFR